MLDILSVQGNIRYSWEEKIPKAFWRGRDSNRRRLDLIDISRGLHPELFNVSITNFFFFRNEMEKYGPKVEHISIFHFFDVNTCIVFLITLLLLIFFFSINTY